MTSQKKQGQFVVVEGMDGSGKTVSTQYLGDQLEALGVDLVRTREVGGTPISEQLRTLAFSRRQDDNLDPSARMLMIFAARIQHLKRVVFPATSAGKMVLCDRYTPSTKVYQGMIDNQWELMAQLLRVEKIAYLDQAPDVIVYLKVDHLVAYERGVKRVGVDNDQYKNDVQKAREIKDAYDTVIRGHVGRQDCLVYQIDANKDWESVQSQLKMVARMIAQRNEQMPLLT